MIRELPAPSQDVTPGAQKWMNLARQRYFMRGPTECFGDWVADDAQTVFLGKLPRFCYVMRVHLHVTEAFNSDGTDNISVGWTGTTNALATNTDVATTGVKAVTLGANNGYNSTEQIVNAYYTNGGSEPTTGKAIVIVEFMVVPAQIA